MQPVNLRSFKQKVWRNKKQFNKFLRKLLKTQPRGLDKKAEEISTEVWKEIDCLSCANCCKTMTPTFTKADINRISAHLKITKEEFIDTWLVYEKKDKDWVNKKQPCQFLDLNSNMCSIYEVRPADCAGFPHLTRKRMIDYIHVHQQNIEYCPATFKMVERMIEKIPL